MSFQQGLSGLNATAKSLEVIGNNIANAATPGAKAARAEFSDVYAAALNGAGANPIGIGVNLASVSQQFTQGNILTTENPMDLAINGNGFFQVTDGNNPVTYTRNGQFKIDRDGYIINNQLQRLLGYPADGTGAIQPGAARALQLPTSGINPQVSSAIDMEFNLDSRVGNTAPTAGAQINFADASTYNNATSLNVYDQRGQDVALTFYFQKSATDTWNVFVTANGTTVGGTALAPTPITTMTFPASGAAPTAPSTPITLNIPASTNANGAATLRDSRHPARPDQRHAVRRRLRRDRHVAGRFRTGPAEQHRDREQRHRDGALFQRPEPSGRPDRDRLVPQPAGPAAAGRQRLGPQLHLGRRRARHAGHRQLRACCSRARWRRATST